jgi:site-specific DNA-methyltransferase (adenine-specific)
MPTIPSGSIDAIITDLPYGTTACEWDSVIPLAPMWEQVKRVLKVNGVFVTTASQPFESILINSNIKWFKYNWVWDKIGGSNFMNLDNRPIKTHECILVFSPDGKFTFNPIRVMRSEKSLQRDPIGKKRTIHRNKKDAPHYAVSRIDSDVSIDGTKHPIDILRFSQRETGIVYKYNHPTRKPLALYEYLIRTYTNAGETVLDICMGSGTTGVAAVQTGRDFIGIEKERKYFEIAEKRIAQAQKPLFVESNSAEQPAAPDWRGFSREFDFINPEGEPDPEGIQPRPPAGERER